MNVDDFCYIRCVNCKKVIILPISYENDCAVLTNICRNYNELNECCNNTNSLHGTVRYGVRKEYIKITDLPLALRKEFSPEVTHEFDCGKHSLVVTKHNGDKVIVSIQDNNIIIDDSGSPYIYKLMDD